MRKLYSVYGVLAAALLFLAGCSGDEKKFRRVPASSSGITFRNTLKPSVEFNIFNYMYFYNGGGVATGDVNGDDLPDIYFTANQEPNKLYLNEGDLKFKDITEVAGVEGFKGWTTGVTMVDVNSDGRLDIYVCYLGDYLIYKGKNQLFINEGNNADGIPQFTDRAVEYGLDLVGFSTQAAFFDFDRDGDLDMFMLNHSLHQNGTFGKSTLRSESHPLAGDKLLRNDGGRFVDVTAGSGIYSSVIGYGLGVAVSDVNLDGWPDVYVGNDFHENDYLYINQGNGAFRECLQEQMNHTSRYTMGVDFADFNNDAYPDLIAMDMLPEKASILKASAAEDAYDVYNFKINYGYNHQFARNTLQLNNGNGTFSEIALYAGVGATDWSWSALFADFDLDGHKDIFVANGIERRSNDLDYINFVTVDSIQMRMKFEMSERELLYTEKMPQVKVPNYLYINQHDSTFVNKAPDWGLDEPSYSNGAAYADLDNDGDLDLVTNNVEDEAFVFENRTLVRDKTPDAPHYLKVRCQGKPGNLQGLGAKVFLYHGGQLQMQEVMATRGYQSCVDTRLIFGTGSTAVLDSVIVVWPDGTWQRHTQVKTDQYLTLDQQQAQGRYTYPVVNTSTWLTRSAGDLKIPYQHQENKFVEFNREGLIPHMMSAEGPAAVVADWNGDGRDDLYLGNAKWKKGSVLLQQKDGTFTRTPQPAIDADSTFEDVDAVAFDADRDGDQDLLVVSGGNEFFGQSKYQKPRLYQNDGRGNFTSGAGLPDVYLTGACAAVHDVDGDGDDDIFIGARTTVWKYGKRPDSYLLLNDGQGHFTNATAERAPALQGFGFVKQARWADMNGDGVHDLVLAGEWQPITILENHQGKLVRADSTGLEALTGWWNTVEPVDLDGDGDLDLVAGNLGFNSKLKASPREPVRMYVGDLDKNDSLEQVVSYYIQGVEYPFYTRDEMTKQMPSLKKRYLSYHKFSEATLHDMFSEAVLSQTERYEVVSFETMWFENAGKGKFVPRRFPHAAQFAPVNAMLVEDFNGDGTRDVLLSGNFYPVNIQRGRYDASYGLVLQGKGKGAFQALSATQSGWSVRGEVRALRRIRIGTKTHYLAIRNNDVIAAYTQTP